MIPTWPSQLPRPDRKSWQRTIQDSRQKRSAEAGPPGYGRRYSSVAKLVSMAIEVDQNEREIFWDFHDDDTAFGSLPFRMPDPTIDGWPMLDGDGVPMVTEDGVPILMSSIWLCMFGETPPTETMVGAVRYKIAFSVAVLP